MSIDTSRTPVSVISLFCIAAIGVLIVSKAAAAGCATGDPRYHSTFDINTDLSIFTPLAPGSSRGYMLFGDTVGWTGFAAGGNPFTGAAVTRKNAIMPYDTCTGELDPAGVLPELHLGIGDTGYSATIPTGAVFTGGVLYVHFMYGDVFRGDHPAADLGGMRGHGIWQYRAGTWSFVPSWPAPTPPPDHEHGQANDAHADDDPFLQSAMTLSPDGSAIWIFGANSNIYGETISIGWVPVQNGQPTWTADGRLGAWQVGGRVRDPSAFTAADGKVYVMWPGETDVALGTRATEARQTGTDEQGNPRIEHGEIDALGDFGYGGNILDVRDCGNGSRWYLISFSNDMTYTTRVRWVRNAQAQRELEEEIAGGQARGCASASGKARPALDATAAASR